MSSSFSEWSDALSESENSSLSEESSLFTLSDVQPSFSRKRSVSVLLFVRGTSDSSIFFLLGASEVLLSSTAAKSSSKSSERMILSSFLSITSSRSEECFG